MDTKSKATCEVSERPFEASVIGLLERSSNSLPMLLSLYSSSKSSARISISASKRFSTTILRSRWVCGARVRVWLGERVRDHEAHYIPGGKYSADWDA